MDSEELERLKQRQIKRKKEKEKKKKLFMIAGISVVALIFLIIIISMIVGGGSKETGKTVRLGETLDVREKNYNFDMNVIGSPEKVNGQDYVKITVGIRNNSSTPLNLSIISMHLVDSNKTSLLTGAHVYYYGDTIGGEELQGGEYKQGDLFFSEYDKTTYESIVIDQNMLNSIYYLQVSVLKNNMEYADYYISLR